MPSIKQLTSACTALLKPETASPSLSIAAAWLATSAARLLGLGLGLGLGFIAAAWLATSAARLCAAAKVSAACAHACSCAYGAELAAAAATTALALAAACAALALAALAEAAAARVMASSCWIAECCLRSASAERESAKLARTWLGAHEEVMRRSCRGHSEAASWRAPGRGSS